MPQPVRFTSINKNKLTDQIRIFIGLLFCVVFNMDQICRLSRNPLSKYPLMMQTLSLRLPPFERVEKNIPVSLILCFVTIGIYNLFWLHHQMHVWNELLGYKKY